MLKIVNLLNSEISVGKVEDRIKSSLKEAKVKVEKCVNVKESQWKVGKQEVLNRQQNECVFISTPVLLCIEYFLFLSAQNMRDLEQCWHTALLKLAFIEVDVFTVVCLSLLHIAGDKIYIFDRKSPILILVFIVFFTKL